MSKNQAVTKQAVRDLHQLAKNINDREKTIEQLKQATVSKASDAVTEALLQGQDLLKAKAMLPHGLWGEWLAANCPLVTHKTSCVYMRLASNLTHGLNITGATSIRAALAMIADHEDKPKPKHEPQVWDAYLDGLSRFDKVLKFVEKNPLDKWPEAGRNKLKQDLEPVAKALWPERFAA